ncbi:MAG: hypothetical protein HKN92_12335 [Chitinophagales bacterium]|nr:hypothetical protein [Chitinophagales bacterium]
MFHCLSGMRLLSAFLLLVTIASCKSGNELVTVSIDENYSLEIPSHMEKTDELREDAILQYRNRYRNCYVIAFKQSSDKSLRDYQKEAVSVLTNYLDKPAITDSGITKLGELTAFYTGVFGKMEQEQIYYDHLTIKSPPHFYEVCVWTRGADRRDRYGEELKKILFSFKPN